ncbi:MAG: LytR/AlgR family response regulator transcription factor [Longimicrobiales bacterium]
MKENGTLRALIVDDEAPARRRLRTLLAREPGVTIVAECPDGPSAVEAIRDLGPDLLFLDIQMPEMNGFDVLRAIGIDAVPAVIFVTAYDQYALQAFEAHALDYLLKPFANARFHEALERVRRILGNDDDRTLRRRLEALLESTRAGYRTRIPIRTTERVTFLRPEEIDWIEGAGNYVRIHAGEEEHIVRDTLKGIADRLDPATFLRIHHSHIVNVDRVKELRPWSHGEYIVILRDGTRLTSSRSYSDALRRFVET